MLKPTTFKEDEILFRATSPGGTSLASDADYIPASTAAQVVAAGGLGKFERDRLPQGADRQGRVGVKPFIGELEEGLSRQRLAEGPRDDVPADLPAVHAAARRPGGVRRR